MIEDWVLSKLEPLNGAPLIILRDPQRMIVPGAVVVDGWAEENDYAAVVAANHVRRRNGESARVPLLGYRRRTAGRQTD